MNYSQSFEKLWNARDPRFGPSGDNKKKAYAQYEKIRGFTCDQLIFSYRKQLSVKQNLRSSNQFCPSFPELHRWLRDERYKDEAVDTTVKTTHPSHHAHSVNYVLPSKLGNQRFQELLKVIKAMEDGNKAVKRATLENKLNKNFIKGKSADEIIDYCNRLYG